MDAFVVNPIKRSVFNPYVKHLVALCEFFGGLAKGDPNKDVRLAVITDIDEIDYSLKPLEEKILVALVREKLHGYGLLKKLNDVSDKNNFLKYFSIYRSLTSLEQRGFVSSHWGEDGPNERCGARRKYFLVTGLGAKALQRKYWELAQLSGVQLA